MISENASDASSQTPDLDEGLSRREQNVQKRREEILKCAADIIVTEGVDALTLSKVAKMANVTVPTVHNLYGKKQDIYNHLVDRVSNWMTEQVTENSADRLLDQMEAGSDRLKCRLEKNELFFKAGFLVGERVGHFGRSDKPYQKASKFTIKKYEAFIKNGDLEGTLNPERMSKFLNDNFRVLRSDWVRGELSLDDFIWQMKWCLYVTLMADATPTFKRVLNKRLDELRACAGKL